MVIRLTPESALWPKQLSQRLCASSPMEMHAIGDISLLKNRKTALFCSSRNPGSTILPACDMAAQLRDANVTVISGFHSPTEKACLTILLRGTQPIIICVGRTLDRLRIPNHCRSAFAERRLLFVTPFAAGPKRVTARSATRRNEIVAALADDAFIPFASPQGKTGHIEALLHQWNVPIVPGVRP
jgi:predicted Rossmann fold nucleotide-binding protein DprA/Smf involved in DNA uptake